jgi:hypothetical protein
LGEEDIDGGRDASVIRIVDIDTKHSGTLQIEMHFEAI